MDIGVGPNWGKLSMLYDFVLDFDMLLHFETGGLEI